MDEPVAYPIIAAAAVVYGIFERFISNKRRQENQTVHVIKEDRDAWKARYETEHDEFISYRKHTHAKENDVQAKLLLLNEENAIYKAKTDITPILGQMEQMGVIFKKIVESLNIILHKLGENK